MTQAIEFIAEVPRIVVLRRQDPPPTVCACGLLMLNGQPQLTFQTDRGQSVTHGELVCYRTVVDA